MLVELGVVEQRHAAVLEVFSGVAIKLVAERYGVSRQTVHRWLVRYARYGLSGLADRSTRPGSCPHQMPPPIEARILTLRAEHPGWGPRTIAHRLCVEGAKPLPGRSSIYRCLVRHGLISPQRRRRKREEYRRWERSRAMELWQMDVMGGVRLLDGRELKLISGIDDHSRFCVSAALVPRATARPVCEALLAALRRYGLPEQILTDNGKVFTARFGAGSGEVLFDRLCREHGIRHLLTAPHSPTTTGKVERFHRTIRREFLAGRSFASPEDAQAQLDAWVALYNEERPHQGIGMVAPAKRFALAQAEPLVGAELPSLEQLPSEPDGRRLTRRVSANGKISVETFAYHVGSWLAGQTVEVLLRDDGLIEIFHGGVLIVAHAHRRKLGPEPAALRPRPRLVRPRPPSAGVPVLRLVDGGGAICFAGANYRAGNAYRHEQVEVRVVGDSVQIAHQGRLIRTHAIRHDRSKEHGAFSTPGGRPRRSNAAGLTDRMPASRDVTEEPEPGCKAGGGT